MYELTGKIGTIGCYINQSLNYLKKKLLQMKITCLLKLRIKKQKFRMISVFVRVATGFWCKSIYLYTVYC